MTSLVSQDRFNLGFYPHKWDVTQRQLPAQTQEPQGPAACEVQADKTSSASAGDTDPSGPSNRWWLYQ
jgi:hypothetical protein